MGLMALRTILFMFYTVPISAFASVGSMSRPSSTHVQPLQVVMQANMREMSQMPARMQLLVQELKTLGAQKSQVEEAFASALANVYVEESAAASQVATPANKATPAPATVPQLELKEPATVSDAQAAFRAAWAAGTGQLITNPTQKFLNVIIEDRACVFKFQYTRVFALGFCTLVDAFLPASCRTKEDEAAARKALFIGLGLDEAAVYADAEGMRAMAQGSSKAELLASDDLAQLAASPRHKYTYAFGVGLVVLMRMAGETELAAPGRAYGSTLASRSAVPGAIDIWCEALNLNCASRLTSEYQAPLSIDGIGKFSFTADSGIEKAALRSIAEEGAF